MPELATVLREVVDASATPVTVEEVLGLPEAVPRDRRRWPLLAAAAAVVVLAGAAALALRTAADDSTVQVPATTVLETPPLASCERRIDRAEGGCRVTDEQAAAMLDLPINQPSGIPEGWTLVYHDVRLWDDERRPIADYNRAWFRNPADVGVDGIVPDFVQVTVREVMGATEPHVDRQAGTLDDGTPVFGGAGFIDWVADGRRYAVRWSGIDLDRAMVIANSLE